MTYIDRIITLCDEICDKQKFINKQCGFKEPKMQYLIIFNSMSDIGTIEFYNCNYDYADSHSANTYLYALINFGNGFEFNTGKAFRECDTALLSTNLELLNKLQKLLDEIFDENLSLLTIYI